MVSAKLEKHITASLQELVLHVSMKGKMSKKLATIEIQRIMSFDNAFTRWLEQKDG